ncbi:MAG: HAMP domain-containing histidine kinase [Promethearchaeota archaeon]|nr:MAG: HAMP domain-containing histidine kinase [Candidatus Lokiarchaeota archaeon]
MPVSESNNSINNQKIITIDKPMEKENQFDKELLNRMAHEFKSPLNQIYSAAQLLEDMESEKYKRELINFILDGSKRLIYLMNNFFEYSKDDENKSHINKKKEDIIPIIKNIVKDLYFFIESRKHHIILSLPDSLIINIDKFKIEQVISNLLNNSIKYTPPNGIIKLYLEKYDNYIIISIKDSGLGFKKEDIKKLFKKFTVIKHGIEIDEDLYIEGTGLGLYISKKVIDSHNGKIWAKSEGLNEGSTFYIKLPLE